MEHLLNRNVNDGQPGARWNLLRVQATMRTRRLSSFETMTNKSKMQIMHWVDNLFLGFYLSGDDRLLLAISRMLTITLRHGVGP